MAGLKLSISFFTILPPSALPLTCEISIPLSFAIFRAKGEAFKREVESLSVCCTSISAFDSGTDLTLSGWDSILDSTRADLELDFSKTDTSVPSLPTIAMISFTLAACPFSTPTYNNTPSA